MITEIEPKGIQGCLIIQMSKNDDPYMAYIEIAPHNRGKTRKFDLVAGCLIAFACRLSHIHAEGLYKGYLSFKVMEQNPKNQNRLMTHYSIKYHAQRIGESDNMFIEPKDGQALIQEYLNNH